MGSNKFLIIAFAIVSALALSLVGVSAAEMVVADSLEEVSPSEEIPLLREEEVRAAEETQGFRLGEVYGTPGESYPALPLLETQYYSYSCTAVQIPQSVSTALKHVSSCTLYVDGSFVWGMSFSQYPNGVASVYRGTITIANGTASFDVIWGSSDTERMHFSFDDSLSSSFSFTSSDSSQAIGGSSVNGTLVNGNLVNDLASDVWSVGDALITFVMSSWVVLLPLSCWLVVLCIGAIRKLVKGV